MFAVCELVRFLLANKRETVRCDWLAIVNMAASEWTTLIILPHFIFALSMTAPKQISGTYVFAYEQLQKSLLQQRRHRLLSRPSPPYCFPTFVGQHLFVVWYKCLPINVGQQMLDNICWPTFVCRVSAALPWLANAYVTTYCCLPYYWSYSWVIANIGSSQQGHQYSVPCGFSRRATGFAVCLLQKTWNCPILLHLYLIQGFLDSL